MIPSRDQAEAIGRATGQPFETHAYTHRPSGLTAFYVETPSGIITKLQEKGRQHGAR